MKSVKIKQCKYFMQVIKQNQLPYLLNEEKEVFDTVYKAIRDNKLYNDVGNIIEKEANRIVDEECKPRWNEIAEKMNSLNSEREALEKKQKELAEGKKLSKKDSERLEELNKEISGLSEEYEQIWIQANKKLNEFKDSLIDSKYEHTACFDLHDSEYDLVNRVIGWSVYDWETEWNVVAPN